MASFWPARRDDAKIDLQLNDDYNINSSNSRYPPSTNEEEEGITSSIQHTKRFFSLSGPLDSTSVENNGVESSSGCDKFDSSFQERDLEGFISRAKHFLHLSNPKKLNTDINKKGYSLSKDPNESDENFGNAYEVIDHNSGSLYGSLSDTTTENIDICSISPCASICNTEDYKNQKKQQTYPSLPILYEDDKKKIAQTENLKQIEDISLQTESTDPTNMVISTSDSVLTQFAVCSPPNAKQNKVNQSLRDTISNYVSKNISAFPFGARWTLITTFLATNAIILSFLCKYSTNFVTLNNPMFIGASFKPVTKLGLFRFELCLSMTVVNTDTEMGVETLVIQPWLSDKKAFKDFDLIDIFGLSQADRFKKYTELSERLMRQNHTSFIDFSNIEGDNDGICTTVTINSEMIDNTMWKIAHIFSAWTTAAGFLITSVIICASFCQSVNLVSVSVMLFALYFCQCLSFFFFDSKLCRSYGCSMADGTIYGIASSICWFTSGVSVLKTLQVKRVKETERRRKRRREKRREKMTQHKRKSKYLQMKQETGSCSGTKTCFSKDLFPSKDKQRCNDTKIKEMFEKKTTDHSNDFVPTKSCRQLICPKHNRTHAREETDKDMESFSSSNLSQYDFSYY